MPIWKPCAISHVTFPSPGRPLPAAPQQSLSLRHKSPSMWQPVAGWQIFTPVAPYGAQRRLQQLLHSSQTVPSTPPLQNDGPAGGAPHVPTVAPAAILHTPPQQSFAREQMSPF